MLKSIQLLLSKKLENMFPCTHQWRNSLCRRSEFVSKFSTKGVLLQVGSGCSVDLPEEGGTDVVG